MKDLNLKIVSAEKILFDGAVNVVQLPGTEGTFSILRQHAPMISSLKQGEIIYQGESGDEQKIKINSGFAEVNKNIVTVCIE